MTWNNSTMYEVGKTPKPSGCNISVVSGFILTILVLILVLGVGLVVHYATPPGGLECHCNFSENTGATDQASSLEQCKTLASTGNTAICDSCPGRVTTNRPTTAAPTTDPTSVKIDYTDFLLPKTVFPTLYTIDIRPNIYEEDPGNFSFDGYIKIVMVCEIRTQRITLHSKSLSIERSSMRFEDIHGQEMAVQNVETDTDKDFLIIHLNESLLPSMTYVLEMHFSGPLLNDMTGLYYTYYSRGNDTVYVVASLLAATDARKVFPCFDEPGMTAEFDISLQRKRNLISISNMNINRTEARSDDYVADIYERTPKMPTYLLAFIVCDFEYTEAVTSSGIPVKVWTRPEAINQTLFSLQTTTTIVSYFEDLFNIPYTLPKLDMIAIPQFAAGAMENWGIITFYERYLLFEPGISSESDRQYVAMVIGHEVSHQWFGNLRSLAWWDDLWLNEGFATLMGYYSVNNVYPEWKMIQQLIVDDSIGFHGSLSRDGEVTSHPLYYEVYLPDQINGMYDSISYAKGAAVIRMMHFFLGDENFKDGIHEYLIDPSFNHATHNRLWEAMENQASFDKSSGISVKEVMDTWTLQKYYPIVTVTSTPTGNLVLKQKCFVEEIDDTSIYGYKWQIPFTFKTSVHPNATVTHQDIIWMDKSGADVVLIDERLPEPGSDEWILGNILQYGFYRVNYAESNWLALIKQLKRDHNVIDPINRAQIINDAWNLASAGYLNIDIAFKTLEYLENEREYVVWKAASTELNYVYRMLQGTPIFGKYQNFMKKSLEAVFSIIGLNSSTDTLNTLLSVVVGTEACKYGLTACVDASLEIFQQWMGQDEMVSPDLRSIVYCSGIQHGGQEEMEFLLKQYELSNSETESVRILTALTCTNQIWMLSRYYELSKKRFHVFDAFRALIYIQRTHIGRYVAWEMIQRDWEDLSTKYLTLYLLDYLLEDYAKQIKTETDLQQLKYFLEQVGYDQETSTYYKSVNSATTNIQWMQQHYEAIETWLSQEDR